MVEADLEAPSEPQAPPSVADSECGTERCPCWRKPLHPPVRTAASQSNVVMTASMLLQDMRERSLRWPAL